ncbi:PaaI family thioesterase [Sandaracinobacter sp. RS1-74]|uniref:PaaI family thioesterase n=1 Tax=Sandaracinobacteroides sayramensis TaxID=2913411 RepID=UPI001EDA64AF|nr:PaaI family thioesterase [Sandaracinobacteroides sayramensis]MCG2841877.1 PaaI family thioesterase [Sandaracinobacteroides sayramensis]
MSPSASSRASPRTHLDGLERLYARAPVNSVFRSRLGIPEAGRAEIRFAVTREMFHAAGAAHGTIYFKMLDDAAFYAANSMVEDQFVLTTQFNLFLTRPVKAEPLLAVGQWVSGQRRVVIAESRLLDAQGEEVARGQGTFMRSRILLRDLPGYLPDDGDG